MPSALDPKQVDRVAHVVRARAGLRLREPAMDVLRDLIVRRLNALAMDLSRYADLIEEASPTSGELEVVIRELTVGETHFFRTPTQFEVLRHHVFPDIIRQQQTRPSPSLRFMSAGCATGEEPYSLAILLREVLSDVDSWRTSVVGIDINTAFLERARQGIYSDWSLRGVPAIQRRHYWSKQGPVYHLRADIRSMVHFRYLNLAFDPLPAPALGIVGMDLIVCQNVLYYFERDVRRAVIDKLVDCLASGGWLLLGPADLLEQRVPLCSARVFGNVVAFQRTERQTVMPPSMRPPGAVASLRAPPPPPLPVEAGQLEEPAEPGRAEPVAVAPLPSIEDATEVANAGNLAGAIELFELILEADPENARAHMLHGFLLFEQGASDEALTCMRRALYLEPELVLAHAVTAMIAQQLGQVQTVRRHAARVRALASSHPEDQAVDGWEGMTVGRLLRLFEADEEGHHPAAGGEG